MCSSLHFTSWIHLCRLVYVFYLFVFHSISLFTESLGLLSKNNVNYLLSPHFKELDLRGVYTLGDDEICIIIQKFNNLRSIKLDSPITQKAFDYIIKYENVRFRCMWCPFSRQKTTLHILFHPSLRFSIRNSNLIFCFSTEIVIH